MCSALPAESQGSTRALSQPRASCTHTGTASNDSVSDISILVGSHVLCIKIISSLFQSIYYGSCIVWNILHALSHLMSIWLRSVVSVPPWDDGTAKTLYLSLVHPVLAVWEEPRQRLGQGWVPDVALVWSIRQNNGQSRAQFSETSIKRLLKKKKRMLNFSCNERCTNKTNEILFLTHQIYKNLWSLAAPLLARLWECLTPPEGNWLLSIKITNANTLWPTSCTSRHLFIIQKYLYMHRMAYV